MKITNKYNYLNLRSEKNIERVIINDFKSKGWILQNEKHLHGVDIKLFHPRYRKYWFIEVKRRYTTKNKKSQTYVNIATAIGQVIYRMIQTRSGFFGIAVPNDKLFIKELNKIPLHIKKAIKLHIFLVDSRRNIKRITPSKKII